jgi:hypothetical protein
MMKYHQSFLPTAKPDTWLERTAFFLKPMTEEQPGYHYLPEPITISDPFFLLQAR